MQQPLINLVQLTPRLDKNCPTCREVYSYFFPKDDCSRLIRNFLKQFIKIWINAVSKYRRHLFFTSLETSHFLMSLEISWPNLEAVSELLKCEVFVSQTYTGINTASPRNTCACIWTKNEDIRCSNCCTAGLLSLIGAQWALLPFQVMKEVNPVSFKCRDGTVGVSKSGAEDLLVSTTSFLVHRAIFFLVLWLIETAPRCNKQRVQRRNRCGLKSITYRSAQILKSNNFTSSIIFLGYLLCTIILSYTMCIRGGQIRLMVMFRYS